MTRADKSDFEDAVQKYAAVMLRCAYSYCGNKADAEDIVQEAFIKYLDKAPKFADEAHRRAWLLRVVINLSKNLQKSFWNRNRSELDENMPSTGSELAGVEIWSAVRRLPPKYRIVIELYYHEGFTIEEIAQITGSRRSTVGDRLKRGKALLKKMFEEV